MSDLSVNVCVITNILAPYRIGLFEALAKRVSRLTVVLMAREHSNRHWELPRGDFETVVLSGVHVNVPWYEEPLHFNSGVWRTLDRLNPDAVISGGFTSANIAAYLFCRSRQKRYFSWGELTLFDGAQRSWVRRLLRRWLISGSDGCIASSSVARRAFEFYGAPTQSVLLAVMPIDVHGFKAASERLRGSSECEELRRRYTGPVLISIGRLVDIKGYEELFEIYSKLLTHFPDATLLIAGEGAQRQEYESLARNEGFHKVHFLGFQQAPELVKYLCIADLFVFHTKYDPFGAVLSEAMACGTLAVASVHAAATHDLIEHQIAGFVIEPQNAQASCDVICDALWLTLAQKQRVRAAAYESVKRWDFEANASMIAGFLQTSSKLKNSGIVVSSQEIV